MKQVPFRTANGLDSQLDTKPKGAHLKVSIAQELTLGSAHYRSRFC